MLRVRLSCVTMQMVEPPCAVPGAVHHLFAVRRVEVTRRLVSEEDGWIAATARADGDALLLAARELRRIVFHAVAHADGSSAFSTRSLRSAPLMPR